MSDFIAPPPFAENRSGSPKKGVQSASLANLVRLPLGVSGNPGGKPVKSRNKLQGDFLRTLADDFAAHGKSAVIEMRLTKPAEYVKVCASLMPKELEVSSNHLDEMTDDQLEATLLAMRTIIDAQAMQAVNLSTE